MCLGWCSLIGTPMNRLGARLFDQMTLSNTEIFDTCHYLHHFAVDSPLIACKVALDQQE